MADTDSGEGHNIVVNGAASGIGSCPRGGSGDTRGWACPDRGKYERAFDDGVIPRPRIASVKLYCSEMASLVADRCISCWEARAPLVRIPSHGCGAMFAHCESSRDPLPSTSGTCQSHDQKGWRREDIS